MFKILNSFEGVKFNLIEGGNNAVAEWEDDRFRYRIYHDSTGNMQFKENLEDVNLPEEDGYLYRQGKVIKKWQELAEEAFDLHGTDQLWGGRPDILLEKYRKFEDGKDELSGLFIGEVKYTENPDYAAQGLKELLEYMGFVKGDGDYFTDKSNVFDNPAITGALFTNELAIEELEDRERDIIIQQYDQDLPDLWLDS